MTLKVLKRSFFTNLRREKEPERGRESGKEREGEKCGGRRERQRERDVTQFSSLKRFLSIFT